MMYHGSAEGGTVTLVIQLNSYNSEGIMMNALVLDNRWSYDGNDMSQDFKIERNLISTGFCDTAIYHNLDCEPRYRIDNGRFIPISKNDIFDPLR